MSMDEASQEHADMIMAFKRMEELICEANDIFNNTCMIPNDRLVVILGEYKPRASCKTRKELNVLFKDDETFRTLKRKTSS